MQSSHAHVEQTVHLLGVKTATQLLVSLSIWKMATSPYRFTRLVNSAEGDTN